MPRSTPALVASIALAFAAGASAADNPEYSKEAVVVQNMATTVKFSSDGARDYQQTLSVRVQSEATVRQFGVLSFLYSSDTQQIKVAYVRVRKVDGSVIETPDSSIMDVATSVATSAPTYSDLREKQIPVKALGVGDVLEYSYHISERTPEFPGQFWYDQSFIDDSVVLNQSLEVSVPKDKYVQISSPNLKPETRDQDGLRVYTWKHPHLGPSLPDDKNKTSEEKDPLRVRLTTFKSWEEVGSWWATMASPQAIVTQALQEKANQLTAGLSSDSDKAQAIYTYVALKFRYISISLGAGRYRPHTAAEVLANQYGDCKDKHTLFVTLLKAAGLQAWPALIGAGIKFDPSVPSPAQFNHVITVLPQNGKYAWLDTTAEVAPFGLLGQMIRDQQALVIPSGAKPVLLTTPPDPPFSVVEAVDVKSSLTSDGTLTGHMELQMMGDTALLMRSAFREVAPAQWQALAQQLSYSFGFSGDVSGVDVDNLEKLDKPFHYSYEYTRKKYSDWDNRRVTAPLLPLGFGPGDAADKPKEPFWAGAPGTSIYRASLQLPKGFSLELPQDTNLTTAFADYYAHYSLKDGAFFAERKLIIKKSKVLTEQWADYQKFFKALQTEQTTFINLSEDAARPSLKIDPEAQRLVQQAYTAGQARNFKEARDLLAQAERLNPEQAGIWGISGFIEWSEGNIEKAIADCRKEIQFHPGEFEGYRQLSWIFLSAGRRDEAIEMWRGALAAKPADEFIALQTARLMMDAKQYKDVPSLLEQPIAAAPGQYALQTLRVEALLYGGLKDQGVAEARTVVKATPPPMILNDLAYYLSDTDSAMDMARELSQKAVGQMEQECASMNLASFESKDLAAVNSLAAAWDTLGWIYFKQNDLPKAEKFIDASWRLNQHAPVGDHLAQVYDKQGHHDAAIHMWRLALASNSNYEDAKEHLRKAGEQVSQPVTARKNTPKIASSIPPAEELGLARTIKIPSLPKQTQSAEFFLLVSKQGIENVQMISGPDALKNAGSAIQAAKYEPAFPDQGPEKIIRRGILSCSTYTTPSCQLTLLLPSTTTMAQVRSSTPASATSPSSSDVVSATLRSKVEPEYSPEAIKARLEGTVFLSIVINEQGIPEDVSVIKPLGMGLDENAKDCVLKWRFNPATKDGKPVKLRAKVEVNFRMLAQPQTAAPSR